MKIAVIGTGSMGANHVRVLSGMDNVDLVAIADTEEKRLQEVSEKYHVEGYTDYKKMLDTEQPDAVTIVVPTSQHHEVAIEAIKRNIHTFVEKPIAASIKEADAIIAAAKKAGVILTVGHIERFNAAIIELKKRIDKGQLGKPFKINIQRTGPFPPRIRDVGVVIDLAVHDIDMCYYLTESEVVKHHAFTKKQIHTKKEDLLQAIFQMKNGVICSLNVDWLTPTKIRKLTLAGEKGMFLVDYLNQDLYFYENAHIHKPATYGELLMGITEGPMTKYVIQKKEPLVQELEHFVDCIKKKKKPIVSGEDGKRALAFALKLLGA